jgi:hypothetical protein
MKFQDFIQQFPRDLPTINIEESPMSKVDEYLTEKLVFHEEEAYGRLQTLYG